jgi:L-alanine-DL-glutamate epimerase-like enolase superfamily enzyme
VGDLGLSEGRNGEIEVSNVFLEIETDAGITGLAGPISDTIAFLSLKLEDLLVGRDPLETETLWDLMYKREVDGRKGERMMAISAVDCALWDIKGKHYDEPVHRLLGGPTRERLPAYASMFLYDTDPDAVRDRAAEIKERGYTAQKWFFQHGPGSGEEGKRKNLALAEAAREGAGEDHDLMFDCWMSWGRSYALDMVDRLAPYDPAWLEEPVMPDTIDSYADVCEAAPFPVAGGEHEYTRWGFHELLSRSAVDIAQPDTYWAGGVSELEKICTLCSVHDVPVVIHGFSVPTNVQVTAAQSPTVCPMVEYLPRLNMVTQFFFEEPVEPEGGSIPVPDDPGMGIRIDDSKVESETELDFGG